MMRSAAVWLLAVMLPLGAAGLAVAQTPSPPAGATAAQPAPEQPTATAVAPSAPVAPSPPAVPTAAAPAAPAAAAPAAPQPAISMPAFPPQPPPVKRGLLNKLTGWWDGSVGYLGSKIDQARGTFGDLNQKSSDAAKTAASATHEAVKNAAAATKDAATATQEAMKNAAAATKDAASATQEAMKSAATATAAATKDAATAIVRLPATRVIEAQQRCAKAGNGAPDCETAATEVCRAKGFNTGKPLDVRTSEACPPAAYLSGRMPAQGACPEETVVLRALCQ